MRRDYSLRLLAGVLVLVVLAAVAVACGDGGDGDDLEPVREQLRQMVLEPEQLPAGFVQVQEVFSTNEDLARASDDEEAEMARLKALGRLLGYEVVFEPEERENTDSPIIGVQNTASLYDTVEGARQSFAEAVQDVREEDWAVSHPGFENLQVREIQASAGTDEAFWFRITGLSGQEDPDLLIDDFVLVRRGNARSLLRVASVSGDTDPDTLLDVVEGLLASQLQRIAAALDAGA